jgi:hypothetical protein
MAELHGVRSAARLLGVTPTSVYISTARGHLRAKVDPTDGQTMLWDEDDLVLFRHKLDAERAAREQAAAAEQKQRFRRANPKRS